MNEIPCVDCICVPVCRHKPYLDFFFQCPIIMDKVPMKTSIRGKYLREISLSIKTTQWGIVIKENGGALVL
ncbi:MAG: hypothetical protein ACTSW1_07780 [Candidatus Hodarchaeales archaeon]